METDNPETERVYTVEFIKKRGPEQVARDTGINRQTLRQIANGRNGPGRKVISALISTYPEYDLKGQLLGVEIGRSSAMGPNDESVSVEKLLAENAQLRLEIDYLRRDRDKTEEEKARYWKLLERMHEHGVDFSAVSSQTTGELFPINHPRTIVRGFEQYKLQGEKKPIGPNWNIPWIVSFAGADKE
jgi:transcriptional regulator with XRE-family HTH domain